MRLWLVTEHTDAPVQARHGDVLVRPAGDVVVLVPLGAAATADSVEVDARLLPDVPSAAPGEELQDEALRRAVRGVLTAAAERGA